MRHKLANILKIFFIMALVVSLGCFVGCGGGEDEPETPVKYTVTVVSGTGGGEYEENTDATVTATIPDGKVFVKWTSDGQDVSTANPYTFKVTKDITLTAVFDDAAPATYTVTVKHGSKTQDTYEETSTEYEAGEEVTITATAIFGKVFTGWYVGETKVSDNAEYTFTVSTNVTLNATYRQETDDFNNVADYVNFLDEAVSLDEIIAIDVKFADNAEAGEKVALCLRGTGWSGIFGYYKLYVDGTLDKEYSGVTVKALEGGWFRLIFDLSALDEHFDNGAAPTDIGVIHTYPGAVMDAFTTACGTINYYGVYDADNEKYTVTVKHGSKTQDTYEETSTEYEAGEEVTITATAIFGKVFTGWYVGETKVSDNAEYTFTVSTNVTLNATYRQETDDFNNVADYVNFLDEAVSLDEIIAIDVKFADNAEAGEKVALCLRGTGWSGIFGYYKLYVDGTLDKEYSGVTVKALEGGWFRLIFDLSALDEHFDNGAAPTDIGVIHTYPGAVMDAFTTACGTISFYGIYEEEIEPDIHDDATAVAAAWSSLEFEPLDNFASSGKALVFDYKATEDVTSGDDFQFTIWGANWTPVRRTNYVAIDVVNNTVSVGTVEALADGWYRVTIPCDLLPINAGEGATGAESIGTMVFGIVNHSFMIDEVGFIDYVPVETKVILTPGYEIDLPDYNDATTLEFDVYATSGSPYAKINIKFCDADGNYYGYYRFTYTGVNRGYADGAVGIEVENIAENTWHVVVTISELCYGSGTVGKLVKMTDSGSSNLDGCWIDNIEFKA